MTYASKDQAVALHPAEYISVIDQLIRTHYLRCVPVTTGKSAACHVRFLLEGNSESKKTAANAADDGELLTCAQVT